MRDRGGVFYSLRRRREALTDEDMGGTSVRKRPRTSTGRQGSSIADGVGNPPKEKDRPGSGSCLGTDGWRGDDDSDKDDKEREVGVDDEEEG